MKSLMRLPWFLLIVLVLGTFISTPARAGEWLKKLDAQGQELPDEATNWNMVLDSRVGLYWEVKTLDDSIHANSATYTYAEVKEAFIARLNGDKFGGFADWRLPTSSELKSLRLKKTESAEANIDLRYFPNTQPAKYMAEGPCTSHPGYREESIKFGKNTTKGGSYVQAVRGASQP